MWKLHRYYCKELLISSVLTFVVLFGVVAVSLVYRAVDRAQGGDLLDAALITILWTADTFPHLMAISLLLGTVSTFARAAADREITAVRAAGISPRVPMAASLLIGMVFSVISAIGLHYVIPWAHYYKYRVGAQAVREFLLTTRVAGDQFKLGDDGVMTWAEEDEDRRFHDVVIFRKGDVFLAEQAWFETEDEIVSLRMRGMRSPLPGMRIEEPTIRLDMRQIVDLRGERDSDIDSDQLLAEVYRGVHENPKGAHYTVHRRSCFALLPCLLAPIGFCIGVLARDRGRAVAMSFALVPLALFFIADFLGMELTRAWDMPAVGWLPAVVLLLAGVPVLLEAATPVILLGKMDRYVGSAVREAWVVCFGTFIAMFILFDMVMNVGSYTRNAGELGYQGFDLFLLLAKHYLYLLPTMVVSFAPFMTVIACMFAVTKLMGANEVVPMVFASRSVTRVLWPAFRVGLLSTVMVAATWQWAVPAAAEPLETLRRAIDQGKRRTHESDLLARDANGSILFCERYDHVRERMEDITVLERDGGEVLAVTRATAAVWDDTAGLWVLENGKRRAGNVIAPLAELQVGDVHPDLLWRIARGQKDGSQLSYTELLDLQELRPGRHDFQLNFWVHVTFPLANLVLLLLALPMAIHFERGSRTARIVQAIVACAAYFVFDLACRNLGLRQFINPLAAAWLPVIVFGALGAVLWSNMRT